MAYLSYKLEKTKNCRQSPNYILLKRNIFGFINLFGTYIYIYQHFICMGNVLLYPRESQAICPQNNIRIDVFDYIFAISLNNFGDIGT